MAASFPVVSSAAPPSGRLAVSLRLIVRSIPCGTRKISIGGKGPAPSCDISPRTSRSTQRLGTTRGWMRKTRFVAVCKGHIDGGLASCSLGLPRRRWGHSAPIRLWATARRDGPRMRIDDGRHIKCEPSLLRLFIYTSGLHGPKKYNPNRRIWRRPLCARGVPSCPSAHGPTWRQRQVPQRNIRMDRHGMTVADKLRRRRRPRRNPAAVKRPTH